MTAFDVYLCVYMTLESAHLLCPILRAWLESGLRQIVLREWVRHLALPVGLMVGVLLVPQFIVTTIYFVWNIWHFGMQNFGLASLLRRGADTPDGRIRRALFWVGLTALGMGLAYQFRDYFAVAALVTIGFNFTHWITDIELSRRTSRWGWGFLAIVLLFGIAWLLLRQGPLSVQAFPQIIRVRDGLGMWHFIYSSRVWKLSDPEVRAAIGAHRRT
jgi:hypothetical protein